MKQRLRLGGIVSSAALALLTAQAVEAADTKITNVKVKPGSHGVEVVLDTTKGSRPQTITVKKDGMMITEVINARLQLPQNKSFVQTNPAPGIDSIQVAQVDANSVRIVVNGDNSAIAGQVARTANGLTLNAASTGQTIAQALPQVSRDEIMRRSSLLAQLMPAPEVSQIMVPNPDIRIEGHAIAQPTNGVPAQLPRAVPPPVGDITFSTMNANAPDIDLGSNVVIPRLVLRDAPAREVLSLLGRAAGINIAYVGNNTPGQAGAAAGTTANPADDVKVSLDIENEPVQNVFNYVLRVTGLQASRSGRTVFVGKQLPNAARQLIMRTVRLNQVSVSPALNFLVGLGAETAVSRERLVTSVNAVAVGTGDGGGNPLTQTQTTTEARVETQRVDYEDSQPLLRGLQVTGDERTNSVTLVGEPNLVQIAVSQLTQLDVRRRQVAVNVRVIDVNLLATNRASTSFSFGVNDTRVINEAGVGVINFGTSTPAVLGLGPTQIGGVTGNTVEADGDGFRVGALSQPFNFVRNFLAQLQIAVTNGNAKILTDPTLVVQEGQRAEVRLTQDVITNLTVREEGTGDDRTRETEFERQPAGLILGVQVDRIDDNGFVSMSVAPSISAPSGEFRSNIGGDGLSITLLATRQLTSGQIRVRDGQTLILSGIIQDQDRSTVTKIPILGDIPLLGALFRNTSRDNQRREVIVLLTPQVLDDSNGNVAGYRYNPLPETQEMMQRN